MHQFTVLAFLIYKPFVQPTFLKLQALNRRIIQPVAISGDYIISRAKLALTFGAHSWYRENIHCHAKEDRIIVFHPLPILQWVDDLLLSFSRGAFRESF